MKHKIRVAVWIVALVFLQGMMGLATGGCGGAKTTTVSASISLPYELLQVESYQVKLTLFDRVDDSLLEGPVTLTYDETNSIWMGEVEDMSELAFLAKVDVVVPYPEEDELVLASAEEEFFVPKDVSLATVTFKPADFDTNLDDDEDTFSNVTEYLNDTDPWTFNEGGKP